jgi:[glutamine synthetase] adenylyltransferase / [glutamine synthetase]-adenylyl-L-tyrosine phosphorylase
MDISPFFAELVEREPELARQAFEQIQDRLDRDQLYERYGRFLLSQSEQELRIRLLSLRQREMIRIIFRDLTRLSSLAETTRELSDLADFCIGQALDHAYTMELEKYGVLDAENRPEQMIVLGMGKLGAYELNLSSDVDLIFLYTNQGQIEVKNGRQLSFQEFFLRLARRVISCLDDSSAIGSVFRVDMRLRPYGDSGPLVMHRAAMEKYYLEQGRDWERYAFIKARVIAGDFQGGTEFLEWMKPFVYRRHLDFGAIQSLREMKALIARQVELKEMSQDLKLGRGGIREVEFIAQAHQLIWGGRYQLLQETSLMKVLDQLRDMEFLPAGDVNSLKAAYIFLRNSEHAVQAENDRQTHKVPDDPVSRERLAAAMGYGSFDDYLLVLTEHRGEVSRCFAQLVAVAAEEADWTVESKWEAAWQSPDEEALISLKADIRHMQLQEEVVEAVDVLMPVILQLSARADDPALSRERMIAVVRTILRRSTYLIFLNENPDALARVVELAGISSWIAEKLEAYPILLYELTDRSLREVSVTRSQLEGDLREILRTVEAGDLEAAMDTLRQFKLAATMKIAAMELLDRLSIMQASDGLTALAEVLLETSLELAWQYLEGRHGLPCDKNGQPLDRKIAIVAYGKAGGLELAYGSDLDLVFLCPNEIHGNTDGRSQVNNNVFYVRLGQRIIHILTSFTRFGTLYEADLRLRPQGNKGPLVATMNAFERYQRGEAWTWEHQALVRARFVAGDVVLGGDFEKIRSDIIEMDRDQAELLQQVISMREKMRTHLASPSSSGADEGVGVLGEFDLKHDAGAIVDIEFMVQYAVLGWAAEHRVFSRWSDAMRQLDELARTKVIAEDDANSLQRAYLAFRAAIHHRWLGLETDYDRLQAYRKDVHQIWNKRMLIENG